MGLRSNPVLKGLLTKDIEFVRENYLEKGLKHQRIVGPFPYQAYSWDGDQPVYAKVESTSKGVNTRIFVSNLQDKTGSEIYFNFYTQRGETCENQIKEIKNLCYSDRLSCHRFKANFFRLMLSATVYEFFRLIKKLISQIPFVQAHRWLVNNIQLFFLKIDTIVAERKRDVNIKFPQSVFSPKSFHETHEAMLMGIILKIDFPLKISESM